MRRKITAELEAWAARPNKKPLVIFGARQTGKTTSALDFARSHEGVCRRHPHRLLPAAGPQGRLCRKPRAKTVVATLEALLGREISPGNTLLFLDEIQDCDQAITALKYFATDAPEYPVIAAGSLLGSMSPGQARSPSATSTCSPCTPWTSRSSAGPSGRSAPSGLPGVPSKA